MSVLVCLSKGCARGCVGRPSEGCPYRILHLLDPKGGRQERPRRSGKTTELLALADALVKVGPVYYVTWSCDMARVAGRRGHPDVKFYGWAQVANGCLRGREKGFVLLDEVPPFEAAKIEGELSFHEVVAAYWSWF